jgi:uroporphyrinogen III methyltransferase/synthase
VKVRTRGEPTEGEGTANGDAAARTGRVILVGAGPGDPDLITVRGAAALAGADVVLYDALCNQELLALAPRRAELIDVGKRGYDAPTCSQDEIGQLLVARARAGLNVVRLKGGDPFVFGRGAEEVGICAEAGIAFEVVPGVTAAIAAPAYAGIPVTDGRHAASFAVVTGRGDHIHTTRWAALGTAVDTLVIMMGMSNLSELVGKLIEGGRDPSTPAAAVMNGTLGSQRVVVSELEELPERARRAGLRAPSAVVVGSVVGLRETLSWWERKPLFGVRVLVTRAADQAGEVVSALRREGAEPVVVPLIALVSPERAEVLAELDRALEHLADYDGIVFSSGNAVRYFAERARAIGAPLSTAGGRVFCVGRKTAEAATEAGLSVHHVASGRGDAETLLAELVEVMPPAGLRFLIPKSDLGRTVLPDGLARAGAEVDAVQAYCNIRPEVDAEGLCQQLSEGSLGALTFMSPSAVDHFVDLLDASARQAVERSVVAAVGATTAVALRSAGIEPDVIPHRPGAGELVAALASHVEARARAGNAGESARGSATDTGEGDES